MDHQEAIAVIACREALFANGFQPIALQATEIGVRSSGKAPVASGWTTADAVPDFDPRAPNTGMLCRGLRPADIDDEDPARVRIVRAIIEGVAGASAPWRGRDNTAGGVLLYRAAEGEPGKRVIVYEGGKSSFSAPASKSWCPGPIGPGPRSSGRAAIP